MALNLQDADVQKQKGPLESTDRTLSLRQLQNYFLAGEHHESNFFGNRLHKFLFCATPFLKPGCVCPGFSANLGLKAKRE